MVRADKFEDGVRSVLVLDRLQKGHGQQPSSAAHFPLVGD